MTIPGNTVESVRKRVSQRSFSVHFVEAGKPLTCLEVLARWRDGDQEFHGVFTQSLVSMHFADFFWECCPVSVRTLGEPFEYVVTNAHGMLARAGADPSAFKERLMTGDVNPILSFPNPAEDATLVTPSWGRIQGVKNIYAHLKSFVQWAPVPVQMELWRHVSEKVDATLQRYDDLKPIWVSTDGTGVPWLHVRLDSTPKYIRHRSYISAPVCREIQRLTDEEQRRIHNNHPSKHPRHDQSTASQGLRRELHVHSSSLHDRVDTESMPKQGNDCGVAKVLPRPAVESYAHSALKERDTSMEMKIPIGTSEVSSLQALRDLPKNPTETMSKTPVDTTVPTSKPQEATIGTNLHVNGCSKHDAAHARKNSTEPIPQTKTTQGELVDVRIAFYRVYRTVRTIRVPSNASREHIVDKAISLDAAPSKKGIRVSFKGAELRTEGPAVAGGLRDGDAIEVL